MGIENKTAQHSDVNDANEVKHKQLRRETVGERLQHNCKEMEHERRTELDHDNDVDGAVGLTVGLKTDDYHGNDYESDMDSIDEELSWLTKEMKETFQKHADSEDRIFNEGVRCSTETLTQSECHECEQDHKSDIDEITSDEDDDEKALKAEMKAMKLQQMKLKKELHLKEKAKRFKEQELLKETRRKQKEERIRKRTKQELQEDIMETRSTITSLDEEVKVLREASILQPSSATISTVNTETENKTKLEDMKNEYDVDLDGTDLSPEQKQEVELEEEDKEKTAFQVDGLGTSAPVKDKPEACDQVPEDVLQTYALSSHNWRKSQLADPVISKVIHKLQAGTRPSVSSSSD
ncbi:microfibrillar-associated protein 1-like [Dreissena polymorpha]|uniref:microfibrillar-associated protein 1-like n=1 Tax=Dreissena polymorpha TaxID=45954 RepID=UPI002263DF73|nr:microfibrillar-associated protein 1-like [Dreissena polymorpha]